MRLARAKLRAVAPEATATTRKLDALFGERPTPKAESLRDKRRRARSEYGERMVGTIVHQVCDVLPMTIEVYSRGFGWVEQWRAPEQHITSTNRGEDLFVVALARFKRWERSLYRGSDRARRDEVQGVRWLIGQAVVTCVCPSYEIAGRPSKRKPVTGLNSPEVSNVRSTRSRGGRKPVQAE